MTDMYIRRDQPTRSRKPFIVGFAAILFATLAIWGVYHWTAKPKQQEPVTEETAVSPAETQPAATTTATQPVANQSPSLDEAKKLVSEDRHQEAREKCYEILGASNDSQLQAATMQLLGEIHIAQVFSPRPMPEKTEYTVQSGDSLNKLAKKFSTTMDLIRKGNNVSGSTIRIGDRLRIFSGQFALRVDKSDNIMDVYLNDKFFKRYRVGTGQYNKTPVGTFKILEKIAQPTWWRPDGRAIPFGDPENLLGTHWLSIDVPGYGIHGTWEPDTIGKQASAGCIRLLNEEVEELFMLVPEGTPVIISD